MKDLLLKVLVRLWTIVLPACLCVSFFVGIYFCMWDIWGWSKLVSGILSGVLCVIALGGMGKLFKLY